MSIGYKPRTRPNLSFSTSTEDISGLDDTGTVYSRVTSVVNSTNLGHEFLPGEGKCCTKVAVSGPLR